MKPPRSETGSSGPNKEPAWTLPPRVVVTGASGWIGRALIERLKSWTVGPQPEIIAFGTSARTLSLPSGDLPIRAIGSLAPEDTEKALVYHLAYLTKEKTALTTETDFISKNMELDDRVIRAFGTGRPLGVFVASSGAAAAAQNSKSANLYGLSKLIQEHRFAEALKRLSTPLMLARIFNLAGPYVNKLDGYALSSFVLQALTTGGIAIQATGPVYRSYLHVFDLIDLSLGYLLAGKAEAGPIDLCGPLVLEIGELAKSVATSVDLPLTAVSRPPLTTIEPSIYLGDSTQATSLALALGLNPRSWAMQVADTVAYIRNLREVAPV